MSCNNLVGEAVHISVTETLAGAAPSFASATTATVSRTSAVQTISVSARSTDLNGVFYVVSSGEVSQPIDVYSSAAQLKAILESMLTIASVEVSLVDSSLSSVSPVTGFGRSWAVTFRDSHFQSLLVSVDGGNTADVIAFGGEVLGTMSVVSVERSVKETLLTSVDVMGLTTGVRYAARVSAYNGYLWNDGTVALISAAPKAVTPQSPTRVFMRPLSDTQLAVWWTGPTQPDGTPVTGYEVKWDRTTQFGANANFHFVNATSMVISNLASGLSYSVGVSAYNSVGYSAVALANLYVAESPSLTGLSVTMNTTPPSAPENVLLTVVSASELGVLWNPPVFDGGRAVRSYLVEWDTSPYFLRAGQAAYVAVVPATNASVSPEFHFSYQISVLPQLPTYVRVSAVNDATTAVNTTSVSTPAWPVNATACATMPTHCSATPSVQLLHLPVNPLAQLSVAQVANRLEVTWQQPTADRFGFSTVSSGNNTPDVAYAYRIEWSEYASFDNASAYDARMLTGESVPLDCSASCSVTLGEEVQNVTIASTNGEDLTSGSFALIYPGVQNQQVLLQVRSGDGLVSVLSPGVTVGVNDFLNIDDKLYQVINATSQLKVEIAPVFAGGFSDMVRATWIPYPSTMLNFNATSADVVAHLESQLVPGGNTGAYSNFSNLFDVAVERGSFGRSWLVTFKGEMFYEHVHPLAVLTLANSTFNVNGLTPFGTLHVPSFARTTVSVARLTAAAQLVPGVPLFVRVMAVNSAGVGPSEVCSTTAEGTGYGSIAPRSAPGLPSLPLVYAVPSSNGSQLRVTWGEGETYGGAISAYSIEWIALPFVSWSGFSSVSIPKTALTSSKTFERFIPVQPNTSYSVRVRQYNDRGSSPPSWFLNITDGSPYTNALAQAEDYREGAQVCLPTCVEGLDECVEANSRSILARGLPGYPVLVVPTPRQSIAAPSFDKASVTVHFSGSVSNGDYIHKFRVEWDERSTFDSPVKRSSVVSTTQLNIVGLAMGQTYFIRVFAHTSIGYGPASETYSFVPMQQPDAPRKPVVGTADDAADLATFARSLNVSWTYPAILGPDLVGDGGDAVISYLVEWSRLPFSSIVPSIQQVSVSYTSINSTFSLALATNADVNVLGSSVSAYIPVTASAAALKTILENMPNIASVVVTKTSGPLSGSWLITFSEATYVPLMTVSTSDAGNSVSVTSVQNSSFVNSFYGSVKVPASADFAQSYLIRDLLPGHVYYTRVSAGNSLGFGSRRVTAPASIAVPLTQPTLPTQIDGPWAVPRVYLTSPTSVLLQIGHPMFDGGALATSLTVEWDTRPSFDSNSDLSRSPIGRLVIPSYRVLCTACVTYIAFPSASNGYLTVISYSGNATAVQLLKTGVRIAVVTSDDDVPYAFTVSDASPTLTSIVVDGAGFRMSPFNASVYGPSDLLLLGVQTEVSGLATGSRYFFRASAENTPGVCPHSIRSCGAFVDTFPSSVLMADAPAAPTSLTATVLSTHSASLRWNRPVSTSSVLSYRVDAFTKSAAATASLSFFGDTEIQRISSVASAITGGTFTISLDAFTQELPLLVTGNINSKYFYTSADCTPYLNPLDKVRVLGRTYTVDTQKERNYTGFFVMERIRNNVGDVSIISAPAYVRPTTVPIAYDVDALHMRGILQSTPGFGQVWVDREVSGAGFEWVVTFLTTPGDVPLLVVNSDKLLGSPSTISVTPVRQGSLPDNFASQVVAPEGDVTSVTFPTLGLGTEYFFRVLASSAYGDSVFSSMVSATPAGQPLPPSTLSISAISGSSILAAVALDADPQGSPIEAYSLVIQSNAAAFASVSGRPANSSVALLPSHQVQRVTTTAHTLPFIAGSTFRLAVKSFIGVFNTNIGRNPLHPSKFIAVDGDSKVTRSTTDASVNHPKTEVAPGEFIQVAGQQFRVCMNQDASFVAAYGSLSIDTIPLCRTDDPFAPAFVDAGFTSHTLYDIPVYTSDTMLGQVNSPLKGSSVITIAYDDSSSNPITSSIAVGDWLMVGHPVTGEVFRVSANSNSMLTLATPFGASTLASLSLTALQHATYEVQTISFATSGPPLSSSSAYLTSGFRLRFNGAVTFSTTLGGDNGCLNVGASANDMRSELMKLLSIDSIEVSRANTSTAVSFLVTFSGDRVRGSVPLIAIEDLGAHGCNANTMTALVVQTRKSVVPVYRTTMTAPLPFDCSAGDMKDALEALSLVTRVDVARSVNANGFDWMLTFRSFDSASSTYMPQLLVNDKNMVATVAGAAGVQSIGEYVFDGLTTGVAYTVSASAVNAYGSGTSLTSVPTSLAPVDQVLHSYAS